MKNKTLILLMLTFLSLNVNAQTDSSKVKSWRNEHSFFIEALGSGLLGSVGYSYSFYKYDNTIFNIDMGVGGTFRVKKEMRYINSFVLNFDFSIDKRIYKPLYISTGVTIADYNNIYKIKNIYQPEASLIPKSDLYFMPYLGVTLLKNKFTISLKVNKFYNFFSYNGIMPSLKLKIKL